MLREADADGPTALTACPQTSPSVPHCSAGRRWSDLLLSPQHTHDSAPLSEQPAKSSSKEKSLKLTGRHWKLNLTQPPSRSCIFFFSLMLEDSLSAEEKKKKSLIVFLGVKTSLSNLLSQGKKSFSHTSTFSKGKHYCSKTLKNKQDVSGCYKDYLKVTFRSSKMSYFRDLNIYIPHHSEPGIQCTFKSARERLKQPPAPWKRG